MIPFNIDHETGCWICSYAVNSSGYPHVTIKGKPWPAHRYVWYKYVEPDIEGYQVHHTCDNKRCINPDHLEKLSQSDHASLHSNIYVRGGRGNRKLSKEEAIQVYKAKGTHGTIAQKFGVSRVTVTNIKNGKRYAEVTKNLKSI